ncbi:signal transduction histidine kinase [Azospirillum lipoferum]|uniref:histidine kinase n=1 Tax=Azospirillum lipoferum TaxID=193 RepID=A0A5A9GBN3_AZOLI|nr:MULTISPECIES: ATP-binding protein [Azospirillum]KAA0591761.1 HAMP domain-containing protein [Azospirillum lipoferum]MCP1614846.1 signal transduction histidine kinase [Azospirillum lipoferum]MDW5536403.1 ATP-binding protein [Azospirillum sp. NL1]
MSGGANETRPPSLLASIARWLVLVTLLAVATTALLLYVEFKGTHDRMRQRTLSGVVRVIERAVRGPDDRLNTALTESVQAMLRVNAASFALVDGEGRLLLGSAGVEGPLDPGATERPRSVFRVPAQNGEPPLYGLSHRIAVGGRPYWIQVASGEEELHIEWLLEEFVEHFGWIWLPFALVLILVNLVIIHRGLRPLRRASAGAAAIGPDSVSERLPEQGMPREVLPLVRAVNQALDRLEAGYEAQRSFIADAAHELRTPLAVLDAHLALIGAPGAPIRADVAGMARLVDQLLDLARLDALRIAPDESVDLSQIAVEAAAHLAPLALGKGRLIEVIGDGRPLPVRGAHDPLFRALRNLVENAVCHAPAGSTVSVELALTATAEPLLRVIDRGPGIPPDQRARVFQRFWQGDRDSRPASGADGAGTGGNGTGGAGLGLSIVARTMAAHGGTISVEDTPGGGATFTLRFPPMPRRSDAARPSPVATGTRQAPL